MDPSLTDTAPNNLTGALTGAVFEVGFQGGEVVRDVAAHHVREERTGDTEEAPGISIRADARQRAAPVVRELVADPHREWIVHAQVDCAIAIAGGDAVLIRKLPAQEFRDARDPRSRTKRAVRQRAAGDNAAGPVGVVVR